MVERDGSHIIAEESVDRYRRDMTLLTSGALLGVAVVLMLDPKTRHTIWRNVEGWVRDVFDRDDLDRDALEQEAAATEGGLAGTREWQKVVAPGS